MPASSNPLSSFIAFSRLDWFLLGGVAFLPWALRTALLFPIRTLVFVVTAHFARLIASTMLEHARDLAPSSINLHACAGLVAYLVRSFLGGLLAKVSCCSPSLKFDVLIGHDTQILSSTIFISSLHSHPKALKGMPPPQLKILLFSPLHHKKGKMLPQRGQERQEFGQGQGWPWVKGKVMIGKVDRTRLSPFRLVLGWVFNFSPYPAFLACSCSRSPTFRTVRGLSILFCLPPLHPCHSCLTSLISEEWLLVQLSTI